MQYKLTTIALLQRKAITSQLDIQNGILKLIAIILLQDRLLLKSAHLKTSRNSHSFVIFRAR